MNDTKISSRQKQILMILQQNPKGLLRGDLESSLLEKKVDLSKVTLIRDLNVLLDLKLITTKGVGKATKYIYTSHQLLTYLNLKDYFVQDIDQRKIKKTFEESFINSFDDIYDREEIAELNNYNEVYRSSYKQLSLDLYKKELERFVIELSWKSSKIEGNTYSLLETEALIKEAKRAEGHSQEEAQMILNHKQASDILLQHQNSHKKLSVHDVLEIHQALVDKLNVSTGIRINIVGITGTNYTPLDNEFQLRQALESLVKKINQLTEPMEKALLAVSGLSYIQPFVDGNKRTARLLGNAILMAYDWAPLSYRNVDEVEYKQALLTFYEQHNLYNFKKIFTEQFKFVVDHYFRTSRVLV